MRRQILIEQVTRRQIDRKFQCDALLLQLGTQNCRPVQHPGRQHANETGSLCKGNEVIRADEALLRMYPSYQRFGADHLARGQFNLGLGIQEEFIAIKRAAQLTQEAQAFLAALVDGRIVDGKAAAASLGNVHRNFSATEQRIAVLPVSRITRYTDTGAQINGLVADGDRHFQGLQDALGLSDRFSYICGRQQDGVLVAAETGDFIVFAFQLLLKATTDFTQQAVAKTVTQHVVDVLKTVKIHHQNMTLPVTGLGALNGRIQQGCKLHAIGQIGQRIPIRQASDFEFAVGDAGTHAFKSIRQLADLVTALDFNPGAIVAGTQSLGDVRQ